METNDEIKVDEIEPVEEITETKDEFENDTTDWKAFALKNQGIAKRYQTKLEKIAKEKAEKAKPEEPEQPQDKKEFDYAEKAFLKSSEIKSSEFPFVLEAMQSTGKSLEQILESKYFQAELKEKRELDASSEAIPEGTPRGGGAARDTVEYWIAKGEMPPEDQVELRRKYVNAGMAVEGGGSKFTKTPVVR